MSCIPSAVNGVTCGSSINPLHSSWGSEGQADVGLLLKDLSVRCAQLRELWRLEHDEPPGPWTAEELEEALTLSGVDVRRASGF